ncbi:hypothetical protein C4K00_5551 [Pseudomonas synxantha]|nr:hypothetical protein C4K00_5551 [Pseudomonas synxantha]AZE81360.1 hypothetical protein C4J99_5623 [Pseudomonas synxantha]
MAPNFLRGLNLNAIVKKSPAVTGEFWQNAISQAFCVPKFL